VIRKKVTLLGASAVGKTSLVAQLVHRAFSDIYRTTIGVQIDRKVLQVERQTLEILLWDLEGEDAFAQLQVSYLQGAAGYLLAVDGTRVATLDTALKLDARVRAVIGDLPRALLINKLDLFEKWEVSDNDIRRLLSRGYAVHRCSAKTGAGVEEAFASLAAAICTPPHAPHPPSPP
jgi:small GTP-binding protein